MKISCWQWQTSKILTTAQLKARVLELENAKLQLEGRLLALNERNVIND